MSNVIYDTNLCLKEQQDIPHKFLSIIKDWNRTGKANKAGTCKGKS